MSEYTKQELLKQFFTPDHIVDYMIEEFLTGKEKLILEPSFGSGQFLYKLLKASEKYKELCVLHGNEIDTDFSIAFAAQTEFLNKPVFKIFNSDFLKMDFWRVKYDLIIGNPPLGYKNNKRGEICLDEEFVKKSASILKDDGRIVFLLEAKFPYTIGRFESLFENLVYISRQDFLVSRPSFLGFNGRGPKRDFCIFEFKLRDGKYHDVETNWVYFDRKGKILKKRKN